MFRVRHFQHAFVTPDADRAVDLLRSTLPAPSEPYWLEPTFPVWTPEGEGDVTLKIALFDVGGVQYEVIEPIAGLHGIYYSNMVKAAPMTFHHVGLRVDDIPAARAAHEARGDKIVFSGELMGTQVFFVDLRDSLGHYLEYISAPESYWG